MLRADRHGPQARAVQEGRGLRPGHRRGARPGRAGSAVGRAARRCRATARSRRPSAGSRACSTRGGPLHRRARRTPLTGAGPGSGPGGAPTAIALSPILSARYRSRDLERIRAAAPGARLVTVSVEGLADGPLDDVEVMLRGWLSSEAFDRLLARAPRLAWVHSATSGVERALTPAARERGLVVTNARGVFSRPIAEYVLMMILAVSRRLPAAARAAAGADVAAARGRGAARRHGRHRRARLDRAGRRRRWRARSVAGSSPSRRRAGTTPAATGRGPADGRDDEPPFGDGMLDRVGGPETLPELLAESDFIVLAAPLTPETEDMINDRDAGDGQARGVAHQRGPRPADRRAGPAARAARRSARRRDPRHVPRRAAASRCRRSTTCPT